MPYTQFGEGRQVVAASATAAQLSSTSTRANWVTITAETDNTGVIAVGSSTVVAALATRKGIPLSAGVSKTFLVHDLTEVWIDTTVNGDGVTYVYGT